MRRTVHGGWQDSGGVRGRRNGRVCAACEQLGCGLVGVDLIMELEEPPFFFIKKISLVVPQVKVLAPKYWPFCVYFENG